MTEPLLALIDGNNVLLRAHHALARQNFMTSSGIPTGALFGSVKSHINLVRTLQPTHMVWFFDAGKSKMRTELFDGYKGSRKNKDRTDIQKQFQAFEKFLSIAGVRYYSEQGVEADDLIASAVKKWDQDLPKVIVSADHDLRQLVSSEPRVSVLKLGQGKTPQKVYTPKSVEEEYGFEPSDLPLIWSMTGDSSDDIPGVRGIGFKTAAKILNEHGTIEKALQNEPRLEGQESVVRRNLKLIRLDGTESRLPFDVSEASFRKNDYDEKSMHDFFEQYEINSLRLKTKGPGLYA